jgi:hypothetical protein
MIAQQRAAGGANLPKLGVNNRTKSRTFLKAQALITITSLVAQRYANSKAIGVKRKRAADAATHDGVQQERSHGQRLEHGQHQPDQCTWAGAAKGTAEISAGAGDTEAAMRSCKTDPASVAAQLAWLMTAQPLPEEQWDHEVAYDSGGVGEGDEGAYG